MAQSRSRYRGAMQTALSPNARYDWRGEQAKQRAADKIHFPFGYVYAHHPSERHVAP